DPRLAQNVVGSGPYKLESFRVGRDVVMKARDDFFLKGRPKLDRIIIKYFNDPTTMEVALERGQIGMSTATAPNILSRADEKEGVVVAKHGYEALGALVWLEFNTKAKYIENKDVRHALAYATDVQFLIDKLQGGFSKRSPSPIATGSPFFNSDVPTYKYDLDKAKSILDKAGF